MDMNTPSNTDLIAQLAAWVRETWERQHREMCFRDHCHGDVPGCHVPKPAALIAYEKAQEAPP